MMTPPRKQRGKDLSSDLPIPAILFPFWAFFTRTRAPAIVRANSQSTRTRGTGGGTLGTRENFRDVTQPRRHRRALSRAPGTRRHARVRREGLHAPTRNALKTLTGASRDESARVSRSSRARAARSRGSSRSRRGFAFFFPANAVARDRGNASSRAGWPRSAPPKRRDRRAIAMGLIHSAISVAVCVAHARITPSSPGPLRTRRETFREARSRETASRTPNADARRAREFVRGASVAFLRVSASPSSRFRGDFRLARITPRASPREGR